MVRVGRHYQFYGFWERQRERERGGGGDVPEEDTEQPPLPSAAPRSRLADPNPWESHKRLKNDPVRGAPGGLRSSQRCLRRCSPKS